MNLFSPRLRAQIVKEMLCVLRDPRSRIVLIVPPMMELLIFSFAATLEVKNIDVAVYDRDGGKGSLEFVARVGASSFVRRIHTVTSPADIRDLIDRHVVVAGLEIPETFSRDIAAGRPAKLQAVLDGRRANAAQVTLGYLNSIASRLGADLQSETHAAAETAVVRHWFNPNLNFILFIVPSLAGILITFNAMLTTSLSIARERELGTFDQLLVSPCTPTEIIIAKSTPALLIGTSLGILMVSAGVFLFQIPFTGSALLLFASMVLFIISVVGIGLMISAVSSTQQQAILGTFAVAVPSVLMSGFATPVNNMPVVLQWLAQAIPLKHFLIILQGSFLKALPASEVFANAWPMAAIALVTLTSATVFVRSKLQ